MNTSYGKPWRLEGLFLLLVFGCFVGQRKDIQRLILAWAIPVGVYVLWFVSPKPDHYLLPLMVPMASAVLALVNGAEPWLQEDKQWKKYAAWAALAGFAAFILPQILFHLSRGYELYVQYFV